MEPIFPISALQKDAAAVRAAAKDSIVRLTVDGRGMYIFSTEELFEDYVQRRIREALLEQRIAEGCANRLGMVCALHPRAVLIAPLLQAVADYCRHEQNEQNRCDQHN